MKYIYHKNGKIKVTLLLIHGEYGEVNANIKLCYQL